MKINKKRYQSKIVNWGTISNIDGVDSFSEWIVNGEGSKSTTGFHISKTGKVLIGGYEISAIKRLLKKRKEMGLI